MAGRGPAPKDPTQRVRRGAPLRGEWVDLPPLERPVLPAADDWSPHSVELWTAWRADPVTAQWSPADLAFAYQTIRLLEAGEKASEIRIRMESLGLTPKGKRDLRWRIVEAPAAVAAVPVGDRQLRAV